jgi:hypothetical protein
MSGESQLLSTGYPAYVSIRGVRFSMMHLGRLVELLVTHDALDRIEAPPAEGAAYLARFQRHRERLEGSANAKFVRNEIEDDGSLILFSGDV